MRQLTRIISKLLKEKGSTLHVVYFLDQGKTKSLTLNRHIVLLVLVGVGLAFSGSVFIGGALVVQRSKAQQAEAQALKIKDQLLSYQLRYDKVWAAAYPGLKRSEALAKANPPSVDQPPAQVPASKELAAQIKKTPEVSKPELTATSQPANKEQPQLAPRQIVAKPPKAPQQVATQPNPSIIIKNVKIDKRQGAYHIKFDLVNRGRGKARGLFWGQLTLPKAQGDANVSYSHPKVTQLGEGTPDSSIPTFAVRNYRSCQLTIPQPQGTFAGVPSIAIFLGDAKGQVLAKSDHKFTTNISANPAAQNSSLQ